MSAPQPRGAGAGDAAANAQAVESLDTLVHARDGPGEAARQTAPPVRDAGNLVLGRYRILARLGAGGFGVVFSAHDEVLDRPVAVKRIALPAGTSGDRAAREALAAARLAHPAIVSLYEACAEGDTFVLVSELVEGHTLASLIDSGSLSDEETADIGLALCDALAHAHTRGVIHRDVKPQNVLIPDRPDEGGAPAKLADFGGARLAGEETLTRSGDVVGTLAYMAPEQAAAGEAGEEADLYSLALVLFEAFAGENPVRGPTPAATARRLGSRLPSLAARRPDLPRQLSQAIDVALDPRPHRRRSVEELADGLADGLDAGLSARRGRARRASRRGDVAPDGGASHDLTRDDAPNRRRRDDAQAPIALPEHQASYETERWSRPPRGASDGPPRRPAVGRQPIAGHAGESGATASRPGLSLRAACALPAAALAAAAVASRSLGGAAPPLGAPVAAAGAALAVGLAPRLGWIALAVATATWVAAAGHAGAAVILLAGALAVGAVLRRPGPGWSAPALAPLLGAVGLAGAYPALAGQAVHWRRRAALGALGYWWLCLAEPLTGARLWLGPPRGVAMSPATWDSSAVSAFSHVLWPLLVPGTLFGMLLWAAGAAVLPWVVSGRSWAVDVVTASIWTAMLCAAAPLVDRGLGAHMATAPRGAVIGAVLAGALAVAARAVRSPPASRRARANRRQGDAGAVSRAL